MSHHLKMGFMAKWRVLSLSLGVTWLMTPVGKGAYLQYPSVFVNGRFRRLYFVSSKNHAFNFFQPLRLK